MTKSEIAKRYSLFVISLFFSAMGVALTRHGELGVSPISSVANVISYKLPEISFGTWLVIWNCILILGQILLLRKDFKPIQFLQLPLSVLFGLFTDFGMWCVTFIPANQYGIKMALVASGIIVLGFGISLSVIANVIMNSGEAFVKALSDKFGRNFGRTKIVFDVSCVVIAVILSLVFFDLKVIGTREGTIISALCTGLVVNFFHNRLKKPVTKVLVAGSEPAEFQNPLLELMKTDVYTVHGNDTIVNALKLITEKKISGVPVIGGNNVLIGFISDGDIIRYLADRCPSFVNIYSFINIGFDEHLNELMHMQVKDVARKKVVTVDASDDLGEVCNILSKRHIKKAPVMEDRKMIGVINISSITKYALKELSA